MLTILLLTHSIVFVGFAWWYLNEPPKWNHFIGFALIATGAWFIFAKW